MYKSFLSHNILVWILFFILFSSCARYPNISKLEKAKSPNISLRENIRETFKKKAALLIPSKKREEKDYEIGPEDVLKIMVWDHDDLERVVSVSREGDFSYPLIGKVHAEGLTVAQLEKEIANRLGGKYIINPQVTVAVKDYRSKKVFLIGEVGGAQKRGKGAGTYYLTGQTTLIEILSQAGGPTKDAGSEVIVIRPHNKTKKNNPANINEAKADEIITINLRKLLEGDVSQNIYLEPGDTIYVPKAEFFFVFGEVKNPGKYILEKETNVLKAITTAGGVTEKAAINRTKIVRERGGQKIELPAEMTDPVQAEDIIIVPESFF
jgi:polysaccharide export outer membrane protein